MVYYEPVNVTINAPELAKIINNMVMRHHKGLKSIVIDRGLLFPSKFLSSLYYLVGIKKKLSIAFYHQINS